MDTDGTQGAGGTHDARGTHATPVPRPAGPPTPPAVSANGGTGEGAGIGSPARPSAPPPRPTHAPGAAGASDGAVGAAFLGWLRAPRPAAEPGIWRFAHRPRPAQEPEVVPARQLLSGAVIAFLVGWLVWSLLWNGYLGGWWLLPLYAMVPDSWAQPHSVGSVVVVYLYYAVFAVGIMIAVGRLGRWGEVWRRYGLPAWRKAVPVAQERPPAPEEDPARWPQLRAAGAADAADRLAADARAGLMRDVDQARIARAWQGVRRGSHPLASFTAAVVKDGAAACLHPSGARDLPARAARHDLATAQVRIGTTADDVRNPYAYRGTGLAFGPDLLGTSLLAVGPAGAGKTGSVVWPIAESLCLGALAGRAVVVVVGPAGAGLGAADGYDVVIRIGHPESVHDLDLYGGTSDPDEAAAMLAEALVGDLADPHPGGDSRRSTTVIAQLIGPYHAVHGRFPSVPELRRLLDGAPEPLAALRQALTDSGHEAMLRELDARERQLGHPGDVGAVLADRVALLDRPAFASFFDTTGRGRPFAARPRPPRTRPHRPARTRARRRVADPRAPRARPVRRQRVRPRRPLALRLPDPGRRDRRRDPAGRARHPAAAVRERGRRPDPAHPRRRAAAPARTAPRRRRLPHGAVRPHPVGRPGLRRGVGQGVDRDAGRHRPADHRGDPLGKTVHMLRRVITGNAPTARAVTVRQVERERWSASELAHAVPPGHAVLSLTTVRGEHAPPLLVDLRD